MYHAAGCGLVKAKFAEFTVKYVYEKNIYITGGNFMKQKFNLRLLAMFIIIAMVFTACSPAGPSGEANSKKPNSSGAPQAAKETTEPGTFPISKEPVTITIMVPYSSSQSTHLKDLDMIKKYEEMTNVHVEWDEVAEEAYAEKYKLVLASNNLPDAFGSGYSYDGSIIYSYAKQGLIIPLEDIIEKVGVNTKKYLNEREDFRKLSTYPDGHIYALPSIDENQNIRMSRFLVINHTFLNKLNREVPANLDELYEYLREAVSQDLNGDGAKETGLSFQDSKKITRLFSMFGVSWESNTYLHYTEEKDFTFAPTMEQTRRALEYFHTWYEQGLIDPEIFTQDGAQLKAKGTDAGVALSIADTYTMLNGGDASKNEYHIMNAIPGPDGDCLWARDGLIPGYSPNQFFITNVNQYPEETIRYIDYWMDNGENALTNRFGPEDYSWKWINKTAGIWTETAAIPTGETRNMELSTLYCTWGYGIPYWCFSDFWSQKEITVDNALERGAAIRDSYINVASPGLPNIFYDDKDNKDALTIKTDLFKYVDSSIAKFLVEGVTDEAWDNFVSNCGKLNADRWVMLYKTYYDRMNQ